MKRFKIVWREKQAEVISGEDVYHAWTLVGLEFSDVLNAIRIEEMKTKVEEKLEELEDARKETNRLWEEVSKVYLVASSTDEALAIINKKITPLLSIAKQYEKFAEDEWRLALQEEEAEIEAKILMFQRKIEMI